MEDRWLSVDEIGIYLGIKRDTVDKWINEKEMPAHRIGRLWKFKKDCTTTIIRQTDIFSNIQLTLDLAHRYKVKVSN